MANFNVGPPQPQPFSAGSVAKSPPTTPQTSKTPQVRLPVINIGPLNDIFSANNRLFADVPNRQEEAKAAQSQGSQDQQSASSDDPRREHAEQVLQALIDADAPEDVIEAYKEQYQLLGIFD